MSTITPEKVAIDPEKLSRELDLLVELARIWGITATRGNKSVKVNGRKIKPVPLTSLNISWDYVVTLKGLPVGRWNLSTLHMDVVARMIPLDEV